MIRTGGTHPRGGQLDLDAGLIVLSDSKGNRPIKIVLPSHAVRVLRAWPRFDQEVVFPVERKRANPGKGDGRPGRSGDGSVSGFNTAVVNSRKRSGVDDWSTHDLRRTCATRLERLGVLPDIIDRVLNHAKPKLRATYLHYDYEKERREALERWGAYVFALAGWE
jgi:integrase